MLRTAAQELAKTRQQERPGQPGKLAASTQDGNHIQPPARSALAKLQERVPDGRRTCWKKAPRSNMHSATFSRNQKNKAGRFASQVGSSPEYNHFAGRRPNFSKMELYNTTAFLTGHLLQRLTPSNFSFFLTISPLHPAKANLAKPRSICGSPPFREGLEITSVNWNIPLSKSYLSHSKSHAHSASVFQSAGLGGKITTICLSRLL